MRVIIVGAGIGGLAAAIGLRRAGHEVLIFDKSSLSHEVGAAINVQPNAARVVAKWGFNFERARLVTAKSVTVTSGNELVNSHVIEWSNTEEKYGFKSFYSHRVDLHTELKLLATGEEGEGKPAVIYNRCEVVDYDTTNGSVTLADGTIKTADLVVGADGVHSAAVKKVVGYENPAISTGILCFRTLMPVQEIRDDPECAFFMEEMEGKLRMFTWPKHNHQKVVWYPCRENEVLNIAVFCADKGDLDPSHDWNNCIPTQVLVDEIKDCHPALRHLLSKTKDVRLWKLLFRAPLPSWHQGKLVILGDAAHPMLPFQGQAGAQAIEDGCALGILFSNLPEGSITKETIAIRLASFQKLRRNRTSAVQIFSNGGYFQSDADKEKARIYLEEGQTLPLTPEDYQEYFYSYDVVKASEEELERLTRSVGNSSKSGWENEKIRKIPGKATGMVVVRN
ncbi:putative salicylate hydroxylase protein [Botrytis fragariae]|uniref:Putative salicylate hydroxylase protein n=1 Tax=Botrytis fragariae TaxID=1964551 RepID=A0A8H6AXR0_9HELO|nr:putative salicylate hydroxylase protein [Botrytis fragariae]KAF5875526.1 putative salicylate hydroxylase protein [Botrytis fragariae]